MDGDNEATTSVLLFDHRRRLLSLACRSSSSDEGLPPPPLPMACATLSSGAAVFSNPVGVSPSCRHVSGIHSFVKRRGVCL